LCPQPATGKKALITAAGNETKPSRGKGGKGQVKEADEVVASVDPTPGASRATPALMQRVLEPIGSVKRLAGGHDRVSR
jgi:hypothetical protein